MAEVLSCTISPNGQDVTIEWDVAVTDPTETGTGLSFTEVGWGTGNFSYESGNGTTTWLGKFTRPTGMGPNLAYIERTYTLGYVGNFGHIVETVGGGSVASFSDVPVTNNSTISPDAVPPTVSQIVANPDGISFSVILNEPMQSTSNVYQAFTITGLVAGSATAQQSNWISTTEVRVRVSKQIYEFEDPSGILISYNQSVVMRDLAGNTLGSFSNRPLDDNLSEVDVVYSKFRSPKRLYFWTDLNELYPATFYQFVTTYPNTGFARLGFLTEFDWYPSNTSSAIAEGFTTGELVSIPEDLIDTYLNTRSWWTENSNPEIDLGYIRNVLQGNVPQRDLNPGIFNTFWLDPEPGSQWFSYSDTRQTQEEKDEFFDAMKVINDVYVEELGVEFPIGWYQMYPVLTGRINGGIDYSSRATFAWGLQNLPPEAIDDTPLFGERSFYTSGISWGWLRTRAISNAERVYDRYGKYMRCHMVQAYAPATALPPDSSYVKPPYTTADTPTGGIDVWKALVDESISLIPEITNRPIVVLLRSKYTTHASLQNFADGYSTFEAPFSEEYWKEMIEHLVQHPRVDIIAIFVRGTGMTTNLGNGTTPLDLYTWAAEIIEEYNVSQLPTTSEGLQKTRNHPPPVVPTTPTYSLPVGKLFYDYNGLQVYYQNVLIPNYYVIDSSGDSRVEYPNTKIWDFVIVNSNSEDAIITDIISPKLSTSLQIGQTIPAESSVPFSVYVNPNGIEDGLNVVTSTFVFDNQFVESETGIETHRIDFIYTTARNLEPSFKTTPREEARIAPGAYIDQYSLDINRSVDNNVSKHINSGFNPKTD